MKNEVRSIGLIVALLFLSIPILAQDNKPSIVLFEPDNISTSAVEYSSSFSASGNEVYITRNDGKWGSGGKNTIYYSSKNDGKWSAPTRAPFSGEFSDSAPHLTRDGSTLYFISRRPDRSESVSSDIWLVRKKGEQWSEPIRLEAPINSESSEYSPVTDAQGNLYFASTRAGGLGQGDLYMAKWTNGTFSDPLNLGNALNSPGGEWNLGINQSGDILIFEASDRKENVTPYGDLYISFKANNQWTIAQNIVELNTAGSDLYPHLLHDGKTLFYSSSNSLQSVDVNIYYSDFSELIKRYREKATN